jgi:hypothetical protein
MKRYLFFTYLILTTVTMEAQTTTGTVTGEYYLQGVMETASGFRLNADGTFNFFFSYGAMDREGEGHWKQQDSTIIFNSTQKSGHDYSLLQSKKQNGSGVMVKISHANSMFKKMVHAIIISGNTEERAGANEEGIIVFHSPVADSISLLFELAPEKKFVFAVKDITHNYFEFAFDPNIMEVLFNDFKLQLTETGFTGPHPMDKAKTFQYKKAKHK